MSDLEGANQVAVDRTSRVCSGAGKLRIALASVVVVGLLLTIVLGFSSGSDSNTKASAASNQDGLQQTTFAEPAVQRTPVSLSNRAPTPPPVAATLYTPSPTKDTAMMYTASPTVDYTPTPTASPTPWAQTVAMTDTDVSFKGLSMVSRQTIQETYASCEDLYIDLYMAARLMGIEYIATESSYSYYFGGDMYDDDYFATDDGISTADVDGPSPSKVTDEPTKTEAKHWGTNNQHAGVEEVDTVQSNGVQIFTLYGEEIVVVDAVDMSVLSRTTISGPVSSSCYQSDSPGFLLLNESLVVFTTGYCYERFGDDNSNDDYYNYYDSVEVYNTTVLVYDTATMTLQSNETLSGMYVSARAIGGKVYTVTSSSLDMERLLTYLSVSYIEGLDDTTSTSSSGLNASTYRKKAVEQLDLRLDTFVQHVTRSFDCTSLQKLALLQNANDTIASSSMNKIVTISSFALSSAPLATVSTSMVLPDSLWSVYASTDYLVVAAVGTFYNSSSTEYYYSSPQTYLLGYKLSEDTLTPTSLGIAPGSLLGQYSMDHVKKDGIDYLRLATTDTDELTSFVTVLQLVDDSDDMMPVVGQLTGLGKEGDRIFAVRFQGDRGFVVTFNYTDPFYTIDLSDPTNPLAMGELEVPGFSTYLHPVGDNLILGVGESVDEDFIPVNFLLSLFDVSTFSQPRLVHQWEEVINKTVSSTASSEVEYDTKAFRYLDDTNILIIPLTVDAYEKIPCTSYSYYYDDDISSDNDSEGSIRAASKPPTSAPTKEPTAMPTASPTEDIDECWTDGNKTSDSFDGFRLFKIDSTDGITEHFSVSHASGDFDSISGCYGSGYASSRSFVIDGTVVTMKGHSVLSHNLTSGTELAEPLNLDDETVDCSSNYYYYDDDRM